MVAYSEEGPTQTQTFQRGDPLNDVSVPKGTSLHDAESVRGSEHCSSMSTASLSVDAPGTPKSSTPTTMLVTPAPAGRSRESSKEAVTSGAV